MKRERDLAIQLYYVHEDAGIWSFFQLASRQGVIAPSDLCADGFHDAQGRMSFSVGRIYRFLSVGDAIDLYSYVGFLQTGLVGITEHPLSDRLENIRPDGSACGRERVVGRLLQDDLSNILLTRTTDGLGIHYLDADGLAPESRDSHYFDDVAVGVEDFRCAARLALEEYFEVLFMCIPWRESRALVRQVEVWRTMRDQGVC